MHPLIGVPFPVTTFDFVAAVDLESSMKNKLACIAALALFLTIVQAAWGQWSSDPSTNLALADKSGNDQLLCKPDHCGL